MRIEEIVDDIAGRFGRELDHVFKEQTRTRVIAARAEAVRRYIDKENALPDSMVGQINCIQTEVTDAAECCSVTIGCNVIKTCEPIPSTIRMKGKRSSFKYVGAIDGQRPFTIIDPEELPLLLCDRWAKNQPYYSYINGYIYVFNTQAKNIKIRGIFNDPDEVNRLNDCDGTDGCDGIVDIPDDFVRVIKSLVYEEMSGLPIQMEDEEIKVEDTDG